MIHETQSRVKSHKKHFLPLLFLLLLVVVFIKNFQNENPYGINLKIQEVLISSYNAKSLYHFLPFGSTRTLSNNNWTSH